MPLGANEDEQEEENEESGLSPPRRVSGGSASLRGSASDQENVSIEAAVEAAFGGCAPPGGPLFGSFLMGAPKFHGRVLLVCGLTKWSLGMPLFLPIYIHEKYTPPSCEMPRDEWPAPTRGSVAYTWGLCCGQEWVLAQLSTIFFVGSLVGVLLGGFLSDRYGRRPVALGFGLLNVTCVVGGAISPNVIVYCICRMLCGAADIAVMMSNFTVAVEWVPAGWRSSVAGILFCATAFGELSLVPLCLGTVAFFSGSWRALSLCVGLLSSIAVILQYMFVPESPRWLHAQGRREEAAETLREAAKLNSLGERDRSRNAKFLEVVGALSGDSLEPRPVSPSEGLTASEPSQYHELIKALKKVSTWAMTLLWFSASLGYFALSLAADLFGEGASLYMVAGFSAFCEIPAGLFAAWAQEQPKIGRRLSTTVFFTFGGCLLLLMQFLGGPYQAAVAVVSKFFMTCAFDILYVFTSEVFSTSLRCTALGLCSGAARAASMMAPEVLGFLSCGTSMTIIGAFAMTSAVVCRVLLPETRNAAHETPGNPGGPPAGCRSSLSPLHLEQSIENVSCSARSNADV